MRSASCSLDLHLIESLIFFNKNQLCVFRWEKKCHSYFCHCSSRPSLHQRSLTVILVEYIIFSAKFSMIRLYVLLIKNSGNAIPDQTYVKFVESCQTLPCKLKRGSRVNFEQTLVPNKDTSDSLTINVFGHVSALGNTPLPFVGIHGTSPCNKIFNLDGTKAGCRLKKGQKYIYKDGFPVLSIYPRVIFQTLEFQSELSSFYFQIWNFAG